ncbi:MAG: prolyl oligopeptidase family serine peptidase [Vicingaceae bacterium]|nr:prolyl oligopeptidase family serine peptidase [Vicingaceae bacterium]
MVVERNIVITGSSEKPIVLDAGYLPNGNKKPVVIFAHGFKGFKDWGHFNMVMEYFISANTAFVKFNFSHNGGTVAQPINFPDLEAFGNNNYSKELSDLRAVVDWVQSSDQFPKDEVDTNQIYLIGHSRAGGVAVIAAHEDSRIKKLVCWAPVADLINRFNALELDDWKKNGVMYVPNVRTEQQMPLYYQLVEDALANKDRFSIELSAKNIKIPHLIIHGTEDEAVNLSEGESIHQWNRKSEMFVIKGGNHTFGAYHPYLLKDFPSDVTLVLEKTLSFFL